MDFILWAGTQDTYTAYMNLQSFLSNPEYLADGKITAGIFDDDDDQPVSVGIGSHMVEVDGGVATIKVSGSLINSYSSWNKYFGVVSYPEIRAAVEQAIDDESVEKILINYDTGGGMVSGLDETAQFLTQAKQIKPIISYTATAALSGGYWLGSTGTKFYAGKTAQVGSIGVILVQASMHRMYEEAGYDVSIIRAGKNKALGHPMEALSDEAREKLQADVNTIYGFFTSHVAEHRNVSVSNKGIWAEGNVFYAEQAQALQLVDGVVYYNYLANSLRKTTESKLVSELNLDMEVKAMKKSKVASAVELAKLQSGVSQDNVDVVVDNEPEQEIETTEITDAEKARIESEVSDDVTETVVEEKPEEQSQLQTLLLNATSKLALAENSLEQANAKAEATSKEISGLLEIAVTATHRLQISLNQSPTNLTGLPVSSVIDQWTKASEDFNKTFKIGAQAKAVKTESDITNIASRVSIYPVDNG